MVPFARAAALAACLLLLALPAVAHAQLDLSVVDATGTETLGNTDDVVGPGDRFRIDTTIGTATPLNGASGTLYTATPGVTMEAETSPFPNAPAGGETTNTTPFEALLAGDSTCGDNLNFALNVQDAGGAQDTVTFSIPTGTSGPLAATEGSSIALADGALTNVELNVAQIGRVKRVEVRIDSLTHANLSQLRLELVSPGGATVVLAEAGTLLGANMTDTVFAADGRALAMGTAPYADRFAPSGDLGALEGRVLNGTWTLKVTDTAADTVAGSLDAWGLDTAKAFCFGLPRAQFTADPAQATPDETVTFDGSDSYDATGAAVDAYAWDLDDDGAFDDGDTAQVSSTYPKGNHRIRLRVTDRDGLTDVEILDLPVTLPPTADVSATPTDPLSGDTFRLDAGLSDDPDGDIVRHEWDVDGNGSWEHDSQGTPFIDTSLPRPGTYTARVRVTDDDGARAEASVQVTVGNRPPVAAIADPGVVVKGQPVVLSAAGSADPDGDILLYEWNLDNAGPYDASSTEPTLQHTFATAGPKTVGLRVTDDRDVTATTTISFTVTNPPTVALVATPNPVSLRDPVAFDASGSFDPDDPGTVLTYAWDLDDDKDFDDGTAAQAAASWATAGTRTVRVRVTESPGGASSVGTVDVVVRNMLPLGAVSATPATPKVGEVAQLSAVGSVDPDGHIVRYQWDLDGDGSYEHDTGATPSASTTFANHGNSTVGVRVTDDDGGTGTKTLSIGVLRADEVAGGAGGVPGADGGTPVEPAAEGPGAPRPGGGTEPLPPGDEPAGDDPDPPFGAWLGGAARQRAKTVLRRGLLLSCRAEVAAWCTLRVRISAKDARRLKLGRRAVTVASTALPVPAGESARKRVKLSARARRRLRRSGSVRLRVRASVRAGDGRTVSLKRVVRLRR